MIAFFDTSIHVDVLRGRLGLDDVVHAVGGGPIRLSPIVASELLRGARGGAIALVEDLIARLRPIEPSSWRRCWLDAGRLLPKAFRRHEAVGLARLQNDVLLALTARQTGTLLLTRDAHFTALCRYAPFALKVLDD
jgi:predicted nucleic acid-binding protein